MEAVGLMGGQGDVLKKRCLKKISKCKGDKAVYLEETRPKLSGENRTQAFIIGQRNGPMTVRDITKHIKRNS